MPETQSQRLFREQLLLLTENNMDPVQIGRRRLEAKDYEGAITAFTEAVNIGGSHLLLPAFAGRAQTYVKMNNLRAALRDARQMIEKFPLSSKGYLATGAICQLMKTDEADQAAIAIYERGLNKIKPGEDDRRYELEQMVTKLYNKQHQGKRADPFEKLPAELAMEVLLWLDMPDRVRCLAVSKAWKPFLESIPALWTTLDLSATKRCISEKSLRAVLKRSQNKGQITLEKATIKWFSNWQKPLDTVVSRCPNLNFLRLCGGQTNYMILTGQLISHLPMAKNLKTLIVNNCAAVSPEQVRKVLGACQTLTRAEFWTVGARGLFKWNEIRVVLPLLEHLVLNTYSKHDRSRLSIEMCWKWLDFDNLIPRTPNLKVGRFQSWTAWPQDLRGQHGLLPPTMPDFSKWTRLEVLSFRNTGICRMPRLPKSITCVDLTDHNSGTDFCFEDLQDLRAHASNLPNKEEILSDPERHQLPNLEELHTRGSKSIPPKLFEFLTRASISSGKLRILDVGGRPYEPSTYPPCKSLVGLSLAKSWEWGDDEILEMMKLYPNVKELDLSDTNVSGYGLKKITQEYGPLDKVVLKGCGNISPDAFEYLEGKGTAVVK